MIKTGHYRRAIFVRGSQIPLGQAFGLCQDGYPTDGHPIFPYVEGIDCVVVSHNEAYGRQQIHLAVFEAGAGAAVVETLAQVRIGEEPAPQAKEFIRSQVFLICSRNDAIFTTHNSALRDSRVNVLANNLINTFSEDADPPVFLLEATMDEERYRQIMDQGIGEIDLGISGFQQTLEYAVNSGHIAQSGLMDVIRALWNRDITDADREAAAKISGRFVLKPGHDWGDVQVKSIMTDMAMELLNRGSDDSFAIVTKNGLRVTQDSVRLKESFTAEGNSQVVDANQVFAGLHTAFERFQEIGVLDDDIVVDPNDT